MLALDASSDVLMIKESKRISKLRPIKTDQDDEINRAVQDAYARGEKVWIMRGANVPDSGMHNNALNEILVQVARGGWSSSYIGRTPYAGMFNEAVANYQKKFFDVDYDPTTDIIRTNGGGHAFEYFNFCFTEPGDVIISEDPSHSLGDTERSAPRAGWETWGMETKTFPLIEENGWEPDLDEMRKIPITEKTKTITIVHPNNPVGRVYSEKTLKNIIDFAGENDLLILSDEMYMNVIFEGVKFQSMAKLARDVPVIVISSFSKFFMQPGWGIGYMAIHDPTGDVKEILRIGTKNYRFLKAPTPIIGAAAIGLMSCSRNIYGMKETLTNEGQETNVMYNSSTLMNQLKNNTEYILKRIDEIDGLNVVKPNATFYMFPKIDGIGKTWKTEREFLVQLAREENVALLPGRDFGDMGHGHYRSIGFFPIEFYEEIYDKIERFIKRHTK